MGLNLGMALGGAAQGIQQGMKAVKDYREEKLAQEQRQRQREANALDDQLATHDIGDMVDNATTPESVYNEAMAKSTPQPGPVARLAQTVRNGLNVGQAAQASGVTPPPPPATDADVNAAAGLPTTAPTAAAPAAPAAGMPSSLAGGAATDAIPDVQVSGPRGHAWSETDQAKLLMMRAAKTGDSNAIQNAYQTYTTAARNDLTRNITGAVNMDMLANSVEQMGGHHVTYSPVTGADGKPSTAPDGSPLYNISVDGNDADRPMSFTEAKAMAVGQVTNNPEYPLKAALAVNQDTRAREELNNTHAYQTGVLAIDRQRAANEARMSQIQAQHYGTLDSVSQAQLAEITRENGTLKQLGDYMTGHGQQGGDALTNADDMRALADSAPYTMKSQVETHMVPDPKTGMPVPVVINKARNQVDQVIQAAQQRYQSNRYVQQGIISLQAVPLANGTQRKLYTIKGVTGGGYGTLDAADMAARRLYPKLPPAAAPGAAHAPGKF